MSFWGFATAIVLGIILFWANLEPLGMVFIVVAIIALFYPKAKKGVKTAWSDVKKDAFYPEKKFFDEYPKGAGKQAAEYLVPPKNTGINYQGWMHKTQKIASNFFKELEDLFK